jgi:hypothetical protein
MSALLVSGTGFSRESQSHKSALFVSGTGFSREAFDPLVIRF